MEKRYISESRYKKNATRKRRNASTVKKNLVPVAKNINKERKIKTKKKVNRKVKIRRKQSKITNIITCIILLLLISIISRAILKEENEPFIPAIFSTEENEETVRIGVITEDSLEDFNSSNVVLNELKKYFCDTLLVINQDYSITYKVVSDIIKVSNNEYMLKISEKNNITAQKLKESLDEFRLDNKSIYYSKLNNIHEIKIVDEVTLNIKLKNEDPYFIYNLDISLNSNIGKTNYTKNTSSTKDKLILNKHKGANKELPLKVEVIKYKDMYTAVGAYKQKDIDMFVTNAENVENILGKHEYNIKTYRNGNGVFLFGNPKSKLYQKEEVRQAIVYSINRDDIIKEILNTKGEKIDLPYIYDIVKYKYDVYATENLLLTNKYEKLNKVYTKNENGIQTALELNLIVNKNDETKVKIANKIKNNLSSVGIKVNVEKLNFEKLNTSIENGTYDLLLADVNLNSSPDISFAQEHLYIPKQLEQVIDSVNNSKVQELQANIVNLQTAMSNNISSIGIYSDVSYLIYSKDIIGIDNVGYMKLFNGILE